MATGPDGNLTMYRREFAGHTGKLILAALLGPTAFELISGCAEKGDGGGDKLAQPGEYMIRKANEMYPVSDIPDADAQIKKFEKWADDLSTGEPLMAITTMLYSEKHKISSEGTVTPTPTQTPTKYVEYPFDTNAITMNMITQYLEGKIDESKFSALFDSESVADIVMMKKKGLTVDKYNVTEGRETGSDDVKYLINTYQTKPDASNQVLTGYMHLKLEKKGTKWAPSKVVENEVYTPSGELGFYYVGRFGRTDIEKPQIKHAWVEKKKGGIPLIPEAIENTGMTVDPFIRNVLGRSEVPKGVVTQHYDGGRIITLMKGASKTYQIPSGDYELSFNTNADSPDIDVFDEVIAILPNKNKGGFSTVSIAVSEAYNYKPIGLAWFIKKMSGVNGVETLEIEDGFLDQTLVPADGVPDYIMSR